MSREMTVGIDYTSRDYEGIKRDMIAKLQEKIPEYTDTSETDAGIVILECFAMGIDIVSFYQDIQANETMLYTCEQRKNALNWCRLLGYSPQPSTPARVEQVFVLGSANEIANTVIPKGTVVKTEASDDSQGYIYFTTEKDLTIPAGKFGDEKDDDGNYLYKVSCIHGTQITNEVLGTSTGAKNQVFPVMYFPVVTETIVVQVFEGDSWVTWERVNDFGKSVKTSRHYMVNILDSNQAEIQFGDGNTGMIPPVTTNGIRISYINGGGSSANVSANTITVLHTSNPLVASTFNPEPVYQKGQDKESLMSIKVNAPNYNRVKWGAMTITDFEDLIKALYPEVLYCKAIENADYIDDIDIYIMLKDGVPFDEEKKEVMLAELEERKLVGVDRMNLMSMIEKEVDIVATLIVAENYSREKTTKAVEDYIKNYFAVGAFAISENVAITDLESDVYTNNNGVYVFRVTSPADLVIDVPVGQVVTLHSLTINASGGV